MDTSHREWHHEGYDDLDDWEVIKTDRCGARHLVFLSTREEDKDRATFIVAEEAAVSDVIDWR